MKSVSAVLVRSGGGGVNNMSNWGCPRLRTHIHYTFPVPDRCKPARRRPPRRSRWSQRGVQLHGPHGQHAYCGVVISLDGSFSPSCLLFNPTLDHLHRATRIFSISTTKSGASLVKNLRRLQSAHLSALPPSIQENTFPTPSARNRIRLLPPYLQREVLLVFHVRTALLSLVAYSLTPTLSEQPPHPPELRSNIESTLSPTSQRRLRPLPLPPGAVPPPVSSPTDPHVVEVPQAVLNTSRPGTANIDGYATSQPLLSHLYASILVVVNYPKHLARNPLASLVVAARLGLQPRQCPQNQ